MSSGNVIILVLQTGFRDYLYIGLGGSRVKYNRWLLNIFLVFVISGFWHGANFTFVIWGAMHGLFYIIEILLFKKFPNVNVPSAISRLYLLGFHTLTLIAFRANSTEDLVNIYRSIFSFTGNYFSISNLQNYQDKFFLVILLFSIFILFLKELNEEYALINKHIKSYSILKPIVYICFIVLIFILGNFSANTFIYFQF